MPFSASEHFALQSRPQRWWNGDVMPLEEPARAPVPARNFLLTAGAGQALSISSLLFP